jgi:hypothetical protein
MRGKDKINNSPDKFIPCALRGFAVRTRFSISFEMACHKIFLRLELSKKHARRMK